MDTCTICYIETINKTVCNHSICNECIVKIKQCAVCRKPFGDIENQVEMEDVVIMTRKERIIILLVRIITFILCCFMFSFIGLGIMALLTL